MLIIQSIHPSSGNCSQNPYYHHIYVCKTCSSLAESIQPYCAYTHNTTLFVYNVHDDRWCLCIQNFTSSSQSENCCPKSWKVCNHVRKLKPHNNSTLCYLSIVPIYWGRRRGRERERERERDQSVRKWSNNPTFINHHPAYDQPTWSKPFSPS